MKLLISYIGYDAAGGADAVAGKAEGFDVRVTQFIAERCFGVGSVGLLNALEGVYKRSVGAERLLAGSFEGVLLHQMPVVRTGATFEDVGEGGAGVAFGLVALLVKEGEGSVVSLDVGGGRLEGEQRCHDFS